MLFFFLYCIVILDQICQATRLSIAAVFLLYYVKLLSLSLSYDDQDAIKNDPVIGSTLTTFYQVGQRTSLWPTHSSAYTRPV